MRAGSTKQQDPGQYEVWLVGGAEDFLWLTGLVRREDAERLAEQGNYALEQLGKAGSYVVRGTETEEKTA